MPLRLGIDIAYRAAHQVSLAAANQTPQLWSGGELDYPDLAEDIAIEARLGCS